MAPTKGPSLSGERFHVTYRIAAPNEAAARDRANALCVEQTVEFPADLLPPGPIANQIVGRIEALSPAPRSKDIALMPPAFIVNITYAAEIVGEDLTQLLNVIFGNSSLKRGLRVEALSLSPRLGRRFSGPRFGRSGLRDLCDAHDRPLLCSALKPLGLSPRDLATFAGAFAEGGIDLIKDDHGLADQPFCRFAERTERCAAAVAEANAKTGGKTRYIANISFDAAGLFQRATQARRVGVDGFLIAPGLVGFSTVEKLARDDTLAAPLLCHPALLGSFVVHPDSGLAPSLAFGTLPRLAGCDATIFPNAGGRFGFTQTDCAQIAQACDAPLATLAPIFPVPAGGMRLDRVEELRATYGKESILLIGGDLHRSNDLVARCRHFCDLVRG
ncbi:MAG: ribulose 1,5-bisphosphate carboxylase large subunit [Deltaproteobacteria bacterium]|nr:ribulose 1,5-bisphosphate carboxylase large subunit [Deltaproteobacteria bacterium]